MDVTFILTTLIMSIIAIFLAVRCDKQSKELKEQDAAIEDYRKMIEGYMNDVLKGKNRYDQDTCDCGEMLIGQDWHVDEGNRYYRICVICGDDKYADGCQGASGMSEW